MINETTNKRISLEAAVACAYDLAATKFPSMKDSMFRDFVSLLAYMAGESRQLLVNELSSALENLSLALIEGDARLLLQPRGLKVSRIVDVQEFVESAFFMGQRGYIRPRVMERLWELFHGENSEHHLEVILGGGIGWGKSFMSEMGLGYMLYKLSCFYSPQLEFGLAPGSSLYFIMQSVKQELAKKVLFGQFAQRLRRSDYFCKYFAFDPNVQSELRFPNNITLLPLSSSDTSALGLNVFGGILDELNFMARVLRPSNSRFTGEQEYDQAAKLHTSVVRRMKSRFSVRGRVPGKLFLISSANYPGDFIDRKMKEAETDKAETGRSNIFVVRMAQWESLPEDRLSSERFLVEIGDATRSSRLIASKEEASDPEAVLEVPIDYKEDFKADLEAALRDLAGIPVGGVGAFLRKREAIENGSALHTAAFDGQQLFVRDSVDISSYENSLFALLNEEYFQFFEGSKAVFSIHVDLALSRDSCGFSIGRFGGWKSVGKTTDWDEESNKYIERTSGRLPIIIIDGSLEILPPRVDEIDINLVGDLIEMLNARLPIETVTSDSYQSASLLQRMRQLRNLNGRRIRAGVVSVDSNMAPYAELKQALRDGRLYFPNQEKSKKELRELIIDPKTKRVDHPVGGSKDISDAIAGVTYMVVKRNTDRLNKSAARKILAAIDSPEEQAQEVPVKSRGRRLH